MSITLRTKSLAVLSALDSEFPTGVVSRTDLLNAVDSGVIDRVPQWLTTTTELRGTKRGTYLLPTHLLDGVDAKPKKSKKSKSKKTKPVSKPVVAAVESKTAAVSPEYQAVMPVDVELSFVPKKNTNYIPHGNSKQLRSVLESGRFLPIFVTGLSGNGKTFMIEQEVARAERELFRVNINTATDEDDLIGGFRLIAGNTVWFDGPVIEAMRRGAVLLLDELDLGTEKIMCLQSVLEGKGVFIKKTNQWVTPADGFTVVATGNTKGQGDDTNKFVGANVMNEAFLERFPVWFEQAYPSESTEKRIVKKLAESIGLEISDVELSSLVKFADKTRKAYDAMASEDLITTRRVCLIVELIPIFGSVRAAVQIACNRFCEESRNAMVKFYDAVAEELNKPEPAPEPAPESVDDYIAYKSPAPKVADVPF